MIGERVVEVRRDDELTGAESGGTSWSMCHDERLDLSERRPIPDNEQGLSRHDTAKEALRVAGDVVDRDRVHGPQCSEFFSLRGQRMMFDRITREFNVVPADLE